MPVKDGEQVLCDVRRMDADLPVLILTARQELDTRIRCLDRGADDLMVKPFSLGELRARVRALLRRKRATGLYLRAGDLEVSRLDHLVTRCGHAVELTIKNLRCSNISCLIAVAAFRGSSSLTPYGRWTRSDNQHC